MSIDRELIEEILHAADIVQVISSYISVIKKGRNYVAVCPFHDDTNPSLQISPEKQIFKCFVCGKGGNAITFVELYEKIPFLEAVRKVAEIIGFHDDRLNKMVSNRPVDNSKEPLYQAINDLCNFYHYALRTEEGQKASSYYLNRDLDERLQDEYRLGYAFQDGSQAIRFLSSRGHSLKVIENIGIASHSNGTLVDRNNGRLIFPISDSQGRVVGFSARRFGDNRDEAKYINTPETELFHKAEILFNYHIAKKTARHDGYVYVLEGFMDVFALRRIGIDSCVALMGTALTKNHIALLRALGCEIRLCLDGDKAGQDATMHIISILDASGLKYRIVSNQNDNRDSDEILKQEGPEYLKKYLSQLLNRAEFALSYYQKTNSLQTLEERKKLVYDFIPILLATTDSLELEDYLSSLKAATDFPIEEIRNLYEKAKQRRQKKEDYQNVFSSFHPEKKQLRRFQLAEKEILYQMLTCPEAIEFYQKEIEYFYNEIYHRVANFIVDYYMKYQSLHLTSLLAELEISDLPDHELISEEITNLTMDKTHPQYSLALMEDCKNTIISERQKLFQKNQLQAALRGKSPLEQAEIIATFKKKVKE